MLAFECFEQRWRFPKAYHLFYEYFFKAAVGDTRWKQSLKENRPFGNTNTEAFALMILKNNYHAWMVQASSEYNFEDQYGLEMEERKKDNEGEEEDDFDSSLEITKKSILDEVLPNMEYYMNHQAQSEPEMNDVGNGIGVVPANSNNGGDQDHDDSDDDNNTHGEDWHMGTASSWTFVVPQDPARYLKGWKFTKLCLRRARKKITNSDIEKYASGVEDLQRLNTTAGQEADNAVATPTTTERRNSSRTALLLGLGGPIDDTRVDAVVERRVTNPHVKKRRKLLKELKEFTKKGDDKNVKQRGWTCEGYNYHLALMRRIKNEETEDKQFVKLYREIAEQIAVMMTELAQQNKQTKSLPDRDEVWELE